MPSYSRDRSLCRPRVEANLWASKCRRGAMTAVHTAAINAILVAAFASLVAPLVPSGVIASVATGGAAQ